MCICLWFGGYMLLLCFIYESDLVIEVRGDSDGIINVDLFWDLLVMRLYFCWGLMLFNYCIVEVKLCGWDCVVV